MAQVIGTIGTILVVIIQIAVICRVLTRPYRQAVSRVAWVAVIALVPLLGVIAYLFLGETSVGPERVRRLRAAEARIMRPNDASFAPAAIDDNAASLFALGASIDGFSPVAGNEIVLARDSDDAITRLVADIDAATDTVHLSFYIWLDDHNGGLVADAVSRAAARGVTCRVMVDALGSRAFVKSARWGMMKDAGAHLAIALNDVPRLGKIAVGRVDLRNHRKIAVIDSEISYCGSQNCADAAFLPKAKFAPWVDVFFRVRGPLVAQEQWLFATVWEAETGEELPVDIAARASAAPGSITGQMFGTGPTGRIAAMSDMFTTAISAARHDLTISTPYFVPDQPMIAALCAAPRRGVRTVLILPARNDSWLVAQAARSGYQDMLDAGVELYEYPLGLLHSKTLTVDGRLALVGSANMDRRSLELNYENNLVVTDAAFTAVVRERQQVYLDASARVDPASVAGWSFWRRLVQNTVATLAPLL